MKQIEDDLTNAYNKILKDRFETDSVASWETLQSDSRIFIKKIHKYISDNPSTIIHSFDSLRKDNIFIETSDDSLFRIYSWDTWLGGSMRDFENIFQFKAGDNVYSKFENETKLDEEEYPIYKKFYSQIFTLKTNSKTYYLAIGNGIYSSKDVTQSVSVFTIEKDKLNDTIKLFKTKKELLNEIEVNYDFFSVADRPERPLRLIKYDPIEKILYIPIVFENGEVTERYILYQFKDKYFEVVKSPAKSTNLR